jgi:hypothetical protein
MQGWAHTKRSISVPLFYVSEEDVKSKQPNNHWRKLQERYRKLTRSGPASSVSIESAMKAGIVPPFVDVFLDKASCLRSANSYGDLMLNLSRGYPTAFQESTGYCTRQDAAGVMKGGEPALNATLNASAAAGSNGFRSFTIPSTAYTENVLKDWYTDGRKSTWRTKSASRGNKVKDLSPLAIERLCLVSWQVQKLLSSHGVDNWLIFGSLLGAYRDHAHIRSEWDVDICVKDEHADLAMRVLMASRFSRSAQNKRQVFPDRQAGFMIPTFLDDQPDDETDHHDVNSSINNWIPMQSMWLRQSKLLSDANVGKGHLREWIVPSKAALEAHISIRIDSSVSVASSTAALVAADTCHGNIWLTKPV